MTLATEGIEVRNATTQTTTADLSTLNVEKSNNQSISSPTSVTCNNNEDQQNHIHTSKKGNHSEIGIVSDFVSVSDKTGNSSSLSEEQLPNINVTLYIPALFHLKKLFLVRNNWSGKASLQNPYTNNERGTEITGKLVGWYTVQSKKRD